MKVMQRLPHTIIILLCVLILSACNFPGSNREESTDDSPAPAEAETQTVPEDTDPGADPGSPTEGSDSESGGEATPASAVDAPDGWTAYSDTDLNLSLFIPPGWQALAVTENKLDIREIDGFAWMEINIITTETDDSWSIVYTPGTAPNAILSELVTAAQEDGDFDEPYELPSSTEQAIWATQGVYDILEEPVFIGAVDQSERMLLVLGHALESDDWGGIYLPLYESMIQTITTAN